MLIVGVLLATVVLRFTLVAAVAYVLLPRGAVCPQCAAELALIRNRFLRWVMPRLEHRWCLACGWNGVVRRREPQAHSRVINRTARS